MTQFKELLDCRRVTEYFLLNVEVPDSGSNLEVPPSEEPLVLSLGPYPTFWKTFLTRKT